MDPLTSLVTALAAGAVAALQSTAEQGVKDGYAALKGPAGASVQKPTVSVNETTQVKKNQGGRLPMTIEQFEVCCLISVTVSY